jgi:hypothetical protein
MSMKFELLSLVFLEIFITFYIKSFFLMSFLGMYGSEAYWKPFLLSHSQKYLLYVSILFVSCDVNDPQ